MDKMNKKVLLLTGLCFLKAVSYCQSLKNNATADSSLIKQYQQQLQEYKSGKKDTILLYNLANLAKKLKEREQASIVANDYIKQIKSIYSAKNLNFIVEHTHDVKDPGFKIFKNGGNKIDSIIGPNSSDNFIMNIIYKSEIEPHIENIKTLNDWSIMEKKLGKEYGERGKEITWKAQVITYNNRKDWKNFALSAIPYLKEYGYKQSGYDLNNFAWDVFLHLEDSTSLNAALSWSKLSLEKENAVVNLDTYANLLYKTGKKEEAISIEEKAISQSEGSDKAEFLVTLEKMKKGESTWK